MWPFDTQTEIARPQPWSAEGFHPNVEIRKKNGGFELTAELPGLESSDVDITLAADHVTIKGEKRYEETSQDEGWVRTERRYGSFQRTFHFGDQRVDRDAVTASFDKGVLTVHLPLAAPSTKDTRKVSIQ